MENLKDLNWNHLCGFYEVARAQSLKAGAKSMGLVPSTLSEQLKKLESRLGRTLFSRSSKGLALTSEGQRLYEKCRPLFELGHRILEEYSETTMGGYPVTVGIEESSFSALASEFCSQYWDFYTRYGTVNTTSLRGAEDVYDSVLKGHCDWGITLKAPKVKSLDWAEIGAFQMIFCCAEDVYKKFKNKEDLLANIPLVETPANKGMLKNFSSYLSSHGILPKERIYSDHAHFTRNLCNRGRCVLFLPDNPLDEYKGLKTFQLDPPMVVPLYATWKKSDQGLVSIQCLKEHISFKLSQVPGSYENKEYQIEASGVPGDLLVENKIHSGLEIKSNSSSKGVVSNSSKSNLT